MIRFKTSAVKAFKPLGTTGAFGTIVTFGNDCNQ